MIHVSYFGQGIWLANEDAVLGCVLIFCFCRIVLGKDEKTLKKENTVTGGIFYFCNGASVLF